MDEPIHQTNIKYKQRNCPEKNSKKITYSGREEGKEEFYQLLRTTHYKKVQLDSDNRQHLEMNYDRKLYTL